MPRLAKALGPAWAAISDNTKPFAARLGPGLEAFGALEEKETETIIRTLLSGCTFQPADGPGGELLKVIDTVLMGEPETVYLLCAYAIEVNYGGFFLAVGGLGARFKAKESSALISPTK